MKPYRIIVALLSFVSPAHASGFLDPGAAAWAKGDYAEAAQAYAKASESQDPEALYNLGTTCYKQEAFEEALERFEKALPKAPPALQQKIYYNSGNTRYRLGQKTQEQDPRSTITQWGAALKDLDGALALDPEDADARFNYDFIKQKLEELKKQQEEEQQKKDEQKENKEQKQEEDNNEEKNPEDQDSESGEKNANPDSQEGKDSQPKEDRNPENQEDQKPQEPKQEPKAQEPKEDKEDQPKPAEPKQDKQEKADAQPQQAPEPTPGRLSKEEAARILDAGAQNEKQLPLALPSGNEPTNQKNSQKTW